MPRRITVALSLTMLLATAAHAQDRDVQADIEVIQRADIARTVASETAELRIDEFIDFACSHCAAFHLQRADSLKDLVAAENLNFSVRVFPIPRLMRGFQAAEAAFCAAAYTGPPGFQGMMQQLFENQATWVGELDPTPIFEMYARNINAPMDEYRDCVARDAMAPLIINDIRMAKDGGVRGTPTFVFNKAGEFEGDEQFYSPESMAQFEESIARVRNK
jgi:protein-disulfide isomerase